jgi:hypothetical protein
MKNSILLLLAFLLVSCRPSPPAESEAVACFRKNESALEELVKLGTEHSALRRAEPALKKYPDYWKTPTAADLAAQQRAYEILESIKLDYVAYWRDGATADGNLFCVEVPVYRWGLSLGGYSVCLAFFPNFDSDPPRSDARRKYTAIEKTGWFVEESDTR